MNRYISLTKVLLKSGNNSLDSKKNKKIKTVALWIFIILAFLPTIKLLIDFIALSYDYLYKINQPGLVLSTGISFANMFIFFFGIFYSINVLYFAKDIEKLLPLPLKPSEILGAKFTVALFYEYLTELVLVAPIFVVYGYKSGAGILYYIYSILLFLILPIIPLCIASLLNMIIMSVTNIGKHRDMLRILGGIMGIVIAIGVNMGIQKIGMSSNNPEKIFKMLSEGNNSMVALSNRFFPGSSIASKALVFSGSLEGLVNLILFFTFNIAIVAIFLLLGEKLYFRGVIGGSETSSKRKELDYSKLNKKTDKKAILTTLTIKELKILFRTPVYFMNCIIMNFIFPIFFIIPVMVRPEGLKDIEEILSIVRDPKIATILVGGSLAFSMVLGASNSIASTAISREGQNIFVNKYIPVPYGTQLMAKVMSSVIMGMSGMIIFTVIAMILAKLPIYLAFIILIVDSLGVFFTSMTGIFIDLMFPKLNWDNEVKAVKQNFNAFINIMISFIAAGGLMALMIGIGKMSLSITIVAFSIIFISDIVLYIIITKKGASIFENIEI